MHVLDVIARVNGIGDLLEASQCIGARNVHGAATANTLSNVTVSQMRSGEDHE